MPEVGEKAPDFSLYDNNRKLRSRAEFLSSGHKTIFAFFPGAFTGVCTQEMCAFRDMYGELEKMNGSVVGISVDSPFASKGFAEKHNLTFPLLCDFTHEVIEKYGVVWHDLGGVKGYVSANRSVFVVDGEGVIVYKWVAENPGVFPDLDKVKAALAQA